jgi:aminopeptidase N
MDGLAALRDERALPHLYARTRYGHPERVRRTAALAIPKLASDRRAREHLEELLDDPNPILRIDVVRALADLGDARSRGALRARAEVDLDPRVRRRIKEAVRDLGAGKQKAEQLKDDLEKLQADHAELRARVSKLEARSSEPATRSKRARISSAPTAKIRKKTPKKKAR